EEVVPLDELYRICKAARELLVGEHQVARVIARPFVGSEAKGFVRTPHRHDYAVAPPSGTLLDLLSARHDEVVSVGKIRDIFHGPGVKPVDLGVRRSFADLGQTIAENFGLKVAAGESFLSSLAG